ncbi:oligopeptide transporter [Trichodelitschia bisporula]|uniref:Oligopeptide transporter n=1 Tax=Trichodelitschia bisporula TaxID=703511 RepID=A0A6G1HSH1_9PEZI|nr:oligopeptide transporter [Trichodelitschia bisporula]
MAVSKNAPERDDGYTTARENALRDEEKFPGVGYTGTGTTDGTLEEKKFTTVTTYSDESDHFVAPPETAEELVNEVLKAEDDPTINPWTFRVWFLGMGLSTFGGTLGTIYYFKPQTISVSTVFLAVISYCLGELMAFLIPRKGLIGRWFNPHPFNNKEHAAIVIMASTAANAPLAIEVLSVQKLYYDKIPHPLVGIFLIFASQCLGYGVAGVLRQTLVYPTKMFYPSLLPLNSLIESLHGDRDATKKKMRVFYIGFTVLFFWEFFPEYIMPVLTGISIFCLAKRDSMVFTRLFGGSNGNEGLGFLSICLDWQYVGSAGMWLPFQTICNNLVGYMLCIFTFTAVYYSNLWNARDFPFLGQLLFTDKSNGTTYVQFNQSAILDSNYRVDHALLEKQGLPYFSPTYLVYILSTNMAITATCIHLLLWNYNDIKSGWAFASPANIKRVVSSGGWKFWQSGDTRPTAEQEPDPHYKLSLAYRDAPNWWYGCVLLLSVTVGLITNHYAHSTLPWWGFFIAAALSSICILFFGAQIAITGFGFGVQPVIQMIGGYLHPGMPVANMYFVLFGYNSVSQGTLLLRDLKFAQYAHLSPRCTFVMQMVGTIVGSIFSYIIMSSITTNQREILLSVEGTNVWSGQVVQSYNSQAIAWGGLAKELFSVGGRYQWVTLAFIIGFFVPLPFWLLHRRWPKLRLDYWNTAIISYFIGWLCVGINSSILSYFIIGFFSQLYLRKKHPRWFVKYNYILSAAMDGGTQVLVFILTFAVFGGGGKEVPFPAYWGNNYQKGNYDYCMKDPATKKSATA